MVMVGSQLHLLPTGMLSCVIMKGIQAYVLVWWEGLAVALLLGEHLVIRSTPQLPAHNTFFMGSHKTRYPK